MSGFDVINETINGGTSGTPGAVLTAAYTVTLNDTILEYSTTGGAFAITFPAASAALAGKVWLLVQTTSSANAMTAKSGGGTVNGAAAGTGTAQTVSKIGIGIVMCDGTNYWMQLI